MIDLTEVKSFDEAVGIVQQEVDCSVSCVLIGHSFGGLVARQVAAMSNNIENLVLVSPAPSNPLLLPFKTAIRSLKPKYLLGLIRGKKFAPSSDDVVAMFGRALPTECQALSYGSLTRSALWFKKITLPLTLRRLVTAASGDPTCGPKTTRNLSKKGDYRYLEFTCEDHFPMLHSRWNDFLNRILAQLD